MAGFNWFKRSYEEPEKPAEEEKVAEAEPADAAPASPEDYLKWAKAAYQNIQERQGAATVEPAEETAAEEVAAEETAEKEVAAEEIAAEEAAVAEISVEEVPAQDATAESTAEEVAAQESAPEETASAADALEVATLSVDELPSPPTESEPADVIEEPEPEPALAVAEESLAAAASDESELVDSISVEPEPIDADSTELEPIEPESTEPESTEPEPVEPEASEPVVALDVAPTIETEPVSEPALPFWAQAQAEREERLARLQAEAILEPKPESEPAPPAPVYEPLDIDLDEAFLWSAEVLASQGRRADQISLEEITWLNKLRQGLDKTRRGLVNQLKAIVGQGPLNEEAVDEIESLLLQADVGVAATDRIITSLQAKLKEETLPPEQAIAYLKSLLRDMLEEPLQGKHNLTFTPEKGKLSIWLMTGVNGAGKTTTIGKLAHIATKSDFKCLIGAADTFRAAAVEQVKVWGARSGVEVIANPGQNTDPAAVVFDAISAATSRDIELLLIDTAGRLQNKKNLMDELAKVRRIIDKKAPDANVESLLVLDATLGQNGLRQAQVFAEAAQLSGVVLTKLDGTARGGVALAVVQQLGLPIRFIGAGEGIEDLRPFSSYEFIEALLSG